MMMAMIICKPPHLKDRPQIDRGSDLKGIVKDLAWDLRPGVKGGDDHDHDDDGG